MTTNIDVEELGGRDPHAVLGVRRGVSSREITRAFHRGAARGGHPDIGGDDGTFRRLVRARDILLDPHRLRAYDAAQRRTNGAVAEPRVARAGPTGARTHHGPTSPPWHGTAYVPPRPAAGARTPQTTPAGPSVPAVRSGPNIWAFLTVMLVLAGPFTWPLAVVTGFLALRRLGRAAREPSPRQQSASRT